MHWFSGGRQSTSEEPWSDICSCCSCCNCVQVRPSGLRADLPEPIQTLPMRGRWGPVWAPSDTELAPGNIEYLSPVGSDSMVATMRIPVLIWQEMSSRFPSIDTKSNSTLHGYNSSWNTPLMNRGRFAGVFPSNRNPGQHPSVASILRQRRSRSRRWSETCRFITLAVI